MARYFAQIDDRDIVQRVIVVSDEDCVDSNDEHNEEVGIAFCKILTQDSSSKWKESFKDGSQRGRPAGIGYKYDSTRNAYIPPQPYPSWTLDETTYNWEHQLQNQLSLMNKLQHVVTMSGMKYHTWQITPQVGR